MITHKVPLYRCTVYFTRSRREFSKQAEKWGGYTDTQGYAGLVLESESGNFLMGVFDKNPGTMAHECGHLALSIIKNAGFDAEAGNQEPFCYLLGELVTTFTKEK